jgi:hypothetical protein
MNGSIQNLLAPALTLAIAATPALAVQLSAPSLRPTLVHPAARVPYHAQHIGPHVFFGTIVAMRTSQLVVKLRSGRLQNVDDAQVLADDDYSVPLFVGKLVAIDGTFVRGVFTAQHIFRVTSLNGLQNDR